MCCKRGCRYAQHDDHATKVWAPKGCLGNLRGVRTVGRRSVAMSCSSLCKQSCLITCSYATLSVASPIPSCRDPHFPHSDIGIGFLNIRRGRRPGAFTFRARVVVFVNPPQVPCAGFWGGAGGWLAGLWIGCRGWSGVGGGGRSRGGGGTVVHIIIF